EEYAVSWHPCLQSFTCATGAAPRGVHSLPTRRSSDLRAVYGLDDDQETLSDDRQRKIITNDDLLVWREGDDSPVAGHSLNGKPRSEEHTSELQSRDKPVCRRLLSQKTSTRCWSSSSPS